MATKKRKTPATPVASVDEANQRYQFMDSIIRRVENVSLNEVESALGMYMIGFHFGWKVLYLLHTKRTIRKYEAILGCQVKDVFPELGPDADRTNAYKIIMAASNFWKAVSGEEKPLGVIDKTTLAK